MDGDGNDASRDIGGLVPVVLHGLHVVAEHGRARAEPGARLAKLLPSVSGCPGRVRGDRGERGILARELVGPPVLRGAGAQGHAPRGEGVRERGVLAGAEHPPSVDGLTVIAARLR
jgi:hypothetical protein